MPSTLDVDELSALTQRVWIPVIADNYFNSNAFVARQHKSGPKVDGGLSIRAPLLYTEIESAGAIRGYEPMNITPNEVVTAVDFDYKEYYTAIVLSHREMFLNRGRAAQVSQLKARSQVADMTLRNLMGTGMQADGSSNTRLIDGLEAICHTTNSYPAAGAGGGTPINRNLTPNSWWRCGFRDATPLDLTNANTTMVDVQHYVGQLTEQPNSPTMFLTTQAVFNGFFALMEDKQRFEDEDLASIGFQTIMFRRIPIVVDSHVAAGYLYMLNENFLALYSHEAENFKFDPFRKPINQKAYVGFIYWTGNLTCTNPRFQGVLTAVTGSS